MSELLSPSLARFRVQGRKLVNISEEMMTSYFDHHGVSWEYESHFFVLRSDPDSGRIIGAMTPDFYLPEHELYVEVTMMRQSLATRKHRKARLVHEHHSVMIETLHQRDLLFIEERCLEHGIIPAPRLEAEIRRRQLVQGLDQGKIPRYQDIFDEMAGSLRQIIATVEGIKIPETALAAA